MSKPTSYSKISIFNHWVTVLLFLTLLGVGFFLEFGALTGEEKGPIRDLHKAIGFLFLGFALWRVIWRLVEGFPVDASVMPKWQSVAAHATHWLLLAFILIMPISGTLMSLMNGYPIDIFGLFTVPAFEPNKAIGGFAHTVHGIAPWIVSALILLHLAGAMKHHFIDKDNTVKRMVGRG